MRERISIDSGAVESVIPPDMFAGTHYITANGQVPNERGLELKRADREAGRADGEERDVPPRR